MTSPTCLVNGASTLDGADVTASATYTIALADSASVEKWSLKCIGADELLSATTITAGLSINFTTFTATATAPVAGSSLIFQSIVTDNNGRSSSTTFGVFVRTAGGYRTAALNETTEGNSAAGWTEKFNQIVRRDGVVNVKSYGAKGDNATDDTAAFRSAIAALWRNVGAPTGRVLFIPAGIYLISDTLQFLASTGLTIMGEGRQATLLIWNGASSKPFFQINSSQLLTVKDLTVWGQHSARPSELFFFDYNPTVFASTQFTFDNVQLSGQSGVEDYDIGIRFSGLYGNNDLHVFTNCLIEAYKETGVSMEGSQQKGLLFLGCNFGGDWDGVVGHPGGKSAIDTTRGAGGQGGSFTFLGGSVGHNSVAAFVIGAPNDPIVIDSVNFESNFRLVDNDVAGAGPNGSGEREIIVRGCRDDSSTITYAPDRIRLTGPGAYSVNGNTFNGTSGSLPYILFEGTGVGRYQARGNIFLTNGSFRAKGVRTNSSEPLDWDIGNNLYVDDSGAVAPLMEWLDSNNEAPYIPVTGVQMWKSDYQGHAGKPGFIVRASAFTAAALSQTVKVWDLPRGTRIKSMYLYNFQIPVGPGLSAATVKIGSTVGGNEFILSSDIFSGGTSGHLYGAVTGDLGTNFTGSSFAQGAYMGDYVNTTSIYATITTVGCNLADLTNGYFFLWMEFDVLQRFVFGA